MMDECDACNNCHTVESCFLLYYDQGSLAQNHTLAKKRVDKKPRNSTAQFVRRLNWLVGLYKETDLRFYVNEAALEKFGVMDAV
mgnify:CR=1 FL=1